MQELFTQLDSLKVELDSYRPISKEYMSRIMQKLHLEWNFNSNSMEGNTLTMTETRQLLYYGITAKGKPLKDHIEMRGHDQALKKLEGLIHKEFKLTESLIKDFHKMILEGSSSLQEKEVEINPGQWKKHWNYLYTPTGKQIYFADPKDVPKLMSELINWTNNHLYQDDFNRFTKRKYDLHPLEVACLFHKRFIDIHPFGDGNGRMARILSNLLLMQAGFMPAIVPLKTKDDYYNALNASSIEDMSPLLDYIGNNLVKSMELALEGAKGNPVEEAEDWEKKVAVSKMQIKKSEDELIAQTNEICYQLYKNSLEATFERFSNKIMNAFSDAFINSKICYYPELSSGYYDKNVFFENLQKYREDDNKRFDGLGIQCSFEGFKGLGAEQAFMSGGIEAKIEQYYYIVKPKNTDEKKLSFRKRYSQQLSEAEVTELINFVGEELAKDFESLIKDV
jgi:Fic family protein